MAVKKTTGVKAASGYPQYSGSLIAPTFNYDLIERFYCSTVFGEITTTEYMGEIMRCGDQITFWQAPCVTVRPMIKDGTIKHDTLEARSITLTIDKALEFSFKISMVDERQMCNWDAFRSSMLESAARSAAESIDCCVLNELYVDADKNNRGAAAGVCTHCYNLGAPGAPLVIDKDNIVDFLLSLSSVLNEQCVPRSDRWIVVPSKFEHLLYSSELRDALCCSDTYNDIVMNGKLPSMLAGFNIYVSNSLESVVDPATNQVCYNIVAGWKGAVVFGSQIEETRIAQSHDNWDTFYQGMMVYGFGTIRKEALAHAYITFG
jgi:hypothetical protein